MDAEHQTTLPSRMDHLAELYQMGQPLAVFNTQPRLQRYYRLEKQLLLGFVILTAFCMLLVLFLYAYQYIVLVVQKPTDAADMSAYEQQFSTWQSNFFISMLISFPSGLMGCASMLWRRHIVAWEVPVSFLLCTSGIVEIRPKGISLTRWEEVKSSLLEFRDLRTKEYRFLRIHRKPFTFGSALEDAEGMAVLIKQYIKKGEL